MTDSHKKLINVNKEVSSNKTKHVATEKELSDLSIKGLINYLINGYSILNGVKNISRENGSQNYFVFHPVI